MSEQHADATQQLSDNVPNQRDVQGADDNAIGTPQNTKEVTVKVGNIPEPEVNNERSAQEEDELEQEEKEIIENIKVNLILLIILIAVTILALIFSEKKVISGKLPANLLPEGFVFADD